MKVVWFAVWVSSLFAGFQFLDTLFRAQSAPQQAAGSAMALFMAVGPYIFARACEKLGSRRPVELGENTIARLRPQPQSGPQAPLRTDVQDMETDETKSGVLSAMITCPSCYALATRGAERCKRCGHHLEMA